MNKIARLGLARLLFAASALAFAATSLHAWADPPSRTGRISHAEGETSFFSDREQGWMPARLNFPVTSENSLWTAGRGRAEVRIGAMAMRIDENTILDFVSIDDDNIDTYLQRGTLNIRSRNDGREQSRERIRINIRDAHILIEDNGRYRVDVSEDSSRTRLTVFSGRIRYESEGSRLTVEAGKSLLVRDNEGAVDFRFENAGESSFDRWAKTRDLRWDETHSRYVREQSVSPYMTGYEELDTYGDWQDDREYGRVWTPRAVISGWTPYRYGSWAYVNPWGWTWVDDAPWGFAPFHYGRWVQIGARWGWCPGEYTRRPVYAPALVGWMGQRPGVHVSVSVGPAVGWFPLAPREHYVPSYTNNITYIRNINHITNNVTIVNAPTYYVNRTPGATFVSGQTFVSARPIQANAIRTNAAQVSTLPVVSAPVLPNGIWGKLSARALQQAQSNNSQASSFQPGPDRPAAPPAARPIGGQPVAQPSAASPMLQPGPPIVQPANSGTRALRQHTGEGEISLGAPWPERRAQSRDSVTTSTPTPAAGPAPGTAVAPPPRTISPSPIENPRMRPLGNIESGEVRTTRPFGGRDPQGVRDERMNQRPPDVVRPVETSRPPAPHRPIENRPQRSEIHTSLPTPLAQAAPAPAPATPTPRGIPAHKQELHERDGR